MKQLKMTKQLLLWCLVAVCLTGCQHDDIAPVEPEVTPTETIHVNKQSPWQEMRYDYSYLTPEKVEEANQYLTHEHLTKEDLEQIQEVGTMIFGDYMQTLATDFDHRTPDMIDDELFYAEEVKKAVYGSLIGNFFGYEKKGKNVLNAPHIRPNTKHIGERGDYIFVPIQVYRKGVPAAGPDMPAEMVYYALQLKRDTASQYGWKIYYMGQAGDYAIRGYSEEPWTIMFNESDDFSTSALQEMVPDEYYWKYYIGERDEPGDGMSQQERDWIHHSIPYEKPISTRSSVLYNRQAAASYSYNYAYSYNPNYYSWASQGTDCANFASQCLNAGGLPQDNTWFYNSSSPYASTTWIRARELFEYLRDTGKGSKVPAKYMANAYENNPSGSWCSLEWGDLVFMGWTSDPRLTNSTGHNVVNPYRIRHVMVITHSYRNPSPPHYYGDSHGEPRYKLSGHTTDRQDTPLTDIYDASWWDKHAIGIKIEY